MIGNHVYPKGYRGFESLPLRRYCRRCDCPCCNCPCCNCPRRSCLRRLALPRRLPLRSARRGAQRDDAARARDTPRCPIAPGSGRPFHQRFRIDAEMIPEPGRNPAGKARQPRWRSTTLRRAPSPASRLDRRATSSRRGACHCGDTRHFSCARMLSPGHSAPPEPSALVSESKGKNLLGRR
jgi:hypothetical protein